MKRIKQNLKEIGIILSYIYMLVACYLFNWKPFGIFISYLIEIVVLLLVYVTFRIIAEKRNPDQYRKAQPLLTIFIGAIPLVVFQYFIIGWMSGLINPAQNFLKENLLLTKEFLFAFGSSLFLYTIKAFQIISHSERIKVFQHNFLYSILALTATNSLGVLLVFVVGIHSSLPVLTGMVVVRINLEIYFERKTN